MNDYLEEIALEIVRAEDVLDDEVARYVVIQELLNRIEGKMAHIEKTAKDILKSYN